jgi:multiple sugar transport system substrate-binding protein
MKRVRVVLSLFLIFFLAFSVIACSNSNNKAVENQVKPEEKTPVEELPKVEEPVEAFDLNGDTLTMAMWWDGAPVAGTELGDLSVAKHKEAEIKYNGKIEYINVPWAELQEKVTSSVMSGAPFADMVRLDLKWVPGLVAGGYLTPIDDFVNVNDESLLPDAVKQAGKVGGKQYGFTDSFNQNGGLYYNKRMFADAGLPDPYELQVKGEWTWEAFLNAAKALTIDTNGDGTVDQYGLSAGQVLLAEHLIYSNGGKIVDADAGTVAFDSPEAMEALQFLNELYNVHKVVKMNEGDDWLDPKNFFTQGHVAMTQGWVWEGADRLSTMTDEWGYIFFPKGPKMSDYVVPVTITDMYFIPKGAPHAEAGYQMWKETVLWDQLNGGYVDFLESSLPDENSVNTAKEMLGKVYFEGWRGYNFEGNFTEIIINITNGSEPPATAVERIKTAAQDLMNGVTKQ